LELPIRPWENLMSNRSLRTPLSVLLIALVLSSLSFAVTPDRIAAIDSSNGVVLQKSLHPQAQVKFDQGPVDPSLRLGHMVLMTQPSAVQQKALNKLLAEQQDRTSRNYHKWLTPTQFGEQFGLSQNDMNRITNWLKSQGFVIRSVAGARNLVRFSGTAAQVQSAFKSEIHRYNVNGEEHFANSTPLMVPAALNGIVAGIIGTHNFLMHPATTGNRFSGPKMRPSYADGFSPFPNVLSPADVAVMYDINGLYNMSPAIDGTGETIAILGQTDIFLADINDFRSGFGLTQINTSNCTTNATTSVITACNDPLFQYVLVPEDTDPGQPNSIGDDLAEADIDIEWSGAIAPGAQIIYINAPENAPGFNGVFDSLDYAINTSPIPAPVISMSYGSCEYFAPNFESELQQGLSEGITIVSASGDQGAAPCDRNPPNGETTPPFDAAIGGQGVVYPASSPSVIGVGGNGISLADDSYPNPSSFWNTSNGTNGLSITGPIPEIPWNDDEEFAQFCSTVPNPPVGTLCQPTTGVFATNAQTVQQYIWISAGGGGASNCFVGGNGTPCTAGIAQPSWQSTLNVPNAPTTRTRWVPDVSFLASPNFPGYIICTELSEVGDSGTGSTCSPGGPTGISNNLGLQQPSIFGGTSVGTPVFAGMLALLNQFLGGPSSPGLGDIHPMLYTLALSNSSNHVFNSVTTGDNNVFCQAGTPANQPAGFICPGTTGTISSIGFSASNFDANTKYNLVAGLGSVNANALATAWNSTRTSTTLSVTPSPTSTFQGASVTLTATVTGVSGSGSLGNVTFTTGTTGSTTLGTAAVNGSGIATLATTNLPIGADTITATYNGNSGFGSSSNTTTVTVTQAFSLNLNQLPTSYTVTQGQSAAAAVNLVFGSGFTGTVTFSCPSPGSEITCTAPTATNTAGQVSFTVQTTAPTAELLRQPFDRGSRTFYAALLPGLLGIMFTFGARKRSQRGIQLLGMILVLGVSTMWLSSCGGSNNGSTGNPGTPKGTYTINVSATSGSLTPATAQFQIVVQ
jgi:Pro-kumamolisin, activation domain/Bacterial Ig-like domain (group 3)